MSSATIETTMPGRGRRLPLPVRIALGSCGTSFYFWVWLVAAILGAPMLAIGSEAGIGLTVSVALALSAGMVTVNLVINRFATYRARIVPGYRQVHLAAMGLTGATLFGLSTAWIAIWSQTPFRSTIGWTLLAFAAGCAVFGSWKTAAWAFWLCAIVTLLSVLTVIRDSGWFQEALRCAGTGWFNLLLITPAAFVLVAVARRLWNIDEEHPDFKAIQRRALKADRWCDSPTSELAGGQSTTAASGRIPLPIRLQEWRLERALRRGPAAFGWNVRRWELAKVDTHAVWITPPAMLLAALGSWLVMTGRFATHLPWAWTGYVDPAPSWVMIYAFLFGVAAFPQAVFGGSTRGTLLAFESLRPATRASLVRQRGTTLVWRLAVWSVLFAILWATDCVVWRSRDPNFQISLGVAWGCVEIASLVAFSGLIAWLQTLGLNVRNPIPALLITTTVFIEVVAVGIGFDRGNPAVLYMVAAAIFLAGVWMFRVAYRWWLMMDLE